jgi:AraC-like DNA-binding protein
LRNVGIPDDGVLYSDHCELTAPGSAVAALWSFESRPRARDQRSVVSAANGRREYWLERSDPLLNTILPGTGVSVVVNVGDPWMAGRSCLPQLMVVGPVTRRRILRVGGVVRAVGAALAGSMTSSVVSATASDLVDRIVPLQDLWSAADVARLSAALRSDQLTHSLVTLKDVLVARIERASPVEPMWHEAPRLIHRQGGRVSIEHLAGRFGLSRQQFTRRFTQATGLPPKQFARITRFQSLVHALLSTDVSGWASACSAIGFYDQAHMINEFRAFAGSSPTTFFRPRGGEVDPAAIRLRGRPSEWVRSR